MFAEVDAFKKMAAAGAMGREERFAAAEKLALYMDALDDGSGGSSGDDD